MKYSKFNDEVFFSTDPVTQIRKENIGFLKQVSDGTQRKRSRLCAHKDISSSLHEMFIVHKKNIYVRPHKHLGKSESFHLIEGEVTLILYEDNGDIRTVVDMGSYESGKCFYYRVDEPVFHSILIQSDYIVFHEATLGPFVREDTVYADWAPEESNTTGVGKFLKTIQHTIAERY
jgi:cupin fold WbuC family metalloprotein